MFQYSFMQNAFVISMLISILCPCIGLFLVLRRYSMIGDTLSHASLAGVAIGLLYNGNPIISSFLFTSICGIFIEFLRDYFKKYAELILAIVLSLSVGIAITIMSSGKLHANVNSFIFGSVLTVTREDLYAVLILSIISITTLIFLYNKLVIIVFDEEAAKIAGVNVKLINYIFSILVAATISVSMRIVGVLVLSSMIALPVATAMQLEKGFKATFLYSVLFSVIDILLSLFISYYMNCAPGGITALISVILLALVILIKKCRSLLIKSAFE
ncbi:metal ABC transporter permease [Clostridium bowmanii]|uniref:metal ABC transporter permease n=1 Tax=Clostridium bowmanii TaxID=132925 RepID=UPI001C0E1963|nr:metal ABC transporter permease [Clostridium bowmanii]MBU3190176.1 metal ABC transporter permease [Clostridium bowmanii]MCA1074849.1 metal ABC transporter permease [Clostridium bowmanii]